MEFVSNSECQDDWRDPPYPMSTQLVTSNMVCAIKHKTDTSASTAGQCPGDSGGPLITNEGYFYSIIGKNILIIAFI